MSFWAKNIASGSSIELVPSQDLRITNVAIGDDYKDALGRTSLVISSARNTANSNVQAFTIANLLVARTEQVLINVKLDQGYKYILSCRGSNNLTLLGYYERNPPHVPSGINFNSNISHGNLAPRAVATAPSAISAALPTNGATSTSTPFLGTSQHVSNQYSATVSPNSLSGHTLVPNTAPATVQSMLAAHRPAGRVAQKFNNIPSAVGPSGATILNSGLNPASGSRSNTPYSFNFPTNGIANGTSSSQSTNPSGSPYSFPPSYGNAWPATSDQAFPHQLIHPDSTPSLSGHGQKRRTADSLENPGSIQNSSTPPMKRTKTSVDTDISHTTVPNHGSTSYTQRHHSSSSGQHRSSEQHRNPSTTGQSSILFSSNHVHTPFSEITVAPNEAASEQRKHPSSSHGSSHFSTLTGQDRPLPGQITTATHSTPINETLSSQTLSLSSNYLSISMRKLTQHDGSSQHGLRLRTSEQNKID
ncbi:hypothetical protein F5879DRAFT_926279 [Lentinula edodes]|nr:hypothetical protein F5879DRAFT_926279 [Lentinula edodes]